MNCIPELETLIALIGMSVDSAEIAMNKGTKMVARQEFAAICRNLSAMRRVLADCENPPKPGGPNGIIGCVGKHKGWPINVLECERGCTNAGHGCKAWKERTGAPAPDDSHPPRDRLIESIDEQILIIRALRNQLKSASILPQDWTIKMYADGMVSFCSPERHTMYVKANEHNLDDKLLIQLAHTLIARTT